MRGGGVGDFILTLPVLSALRCFFPSASVEILGDPAIASLAVAGGLAARVTRLESPLFVPFFIHGQTLPEEGRAFFAGFDLIISYLHDPGGVLESNVARCGAGRFLRGPHRPDEGLREHASRILLRPLEAIGVHPADSVPRLNLGGKPRALPGRWLAVHPGSGSPRKNWPEAIWKELLQWLTGATDWNVLLITGEAEGDLGRRLSEGLPAKRIERAEGVPLAELARRMRACAAFIGHDSGITHLAAALGLPGIALWGPTCEITWRPAGDRMRVLRGPPQAAAVLSAILEQDCEWRPPC